MHNVAQVGLETGTSPNVSFTNYRERVKPAEALEWFAIQQETPANVIQVPMVVAA